MESDNSSAAPNKNLLIPALRGLEQLLFRLQKRLHIECLHTIVILFLLSVILLLVTLVVALSATPAITLPQFLLEILRLCVVVIFLGIIVGVSSNAVYHAIRAILANANRMAMIESCLDAYYLPNNTSEIERRTERTLKRLSATSGEICLLGIAGTTYFPHEANSTRLSALFMSTLERPGISLRLLLLNPYSQAAKFRYAREVSRDVDAITHRINMTATFERSVFFGDIFHTLDRVATLKRRGARIECRLTNFDPIISLMYTDAFAYVDVLSLGRSQEGSDPRKQKATFPIQEFTSDSPFHPIAKSHFEYHWKYAITPEELDHHKNIFEQRLFAPSLTGYRVIEQHDSWISVAPVVGCNRACTYCVLQTTFGNTVTPRLYTDPNSVGDLLRESKIYHDDAVICLFNYTDALLPENRRHLLTSLRNLNAKNFRNWVCIPTKQPIDQDYAHSLIASYHKDRLIVLISLSGMPSRYEPSVEQDKLVATMKMLAECHIPVIHMWRPITVFNSGDEAIRSMLQTVHGAAHASVVVGLKASKPLNALYRQTGLLPMQTQEITHGQYLPPTFLQRLHAFNDSHPVYLHTACAVACVMNKPNYTGTMFDPTICALYADGASRCSETQMQVCLEFARKAGSAEYAQECHDIVQRSFPRMLFEITSQSCTLRDGSMLCIPTVKLRGSVWQEDLIYLLHRLKVPISAEKVLYTNQFIGSIVRECP
jgi:DNA repair photolyase